MNPDYIRFAIEVVVLIVGICGTYFTLKNKVDKNSEAVKKLTALVDLNKDKLNKCAITENRVDALYDNVEKLSNSVEKKSDRTRELIEKLFDKLENKADKK